MNLRIIDWLNQNMITKYILFSKSMQLGFYGC